MFTDNTDHGTLQKLKPLAPHVDNAIALAATAAADLLALAAKTAALLALTDQFVVPDAVAANTASLLALLAAQPKFVPEYKAFVIPSS